MGFGIAPYVIGSMSVWMFCTSVPRTAVGALDVDVRMFQDEVRFRSGGTTYIEALVDGRWAGRFWGADAHTIWPRELWTADAFEIEINGHAVSNTWRKESASDGAGPGEGTQQCVVMLAHATRPLTVAVHTLLDGTAILKRWLDITNTGSESVALTALLPWTSELWADSGYKKAPEGFERPFNLGYFTEYGWGSEGWFEWAPLVPDELKVVIGDKGQGYDDPFFIVQSAFTGEYLIGHLAWSANWRMEFECKSTLPGSHGPDGLAGPYYVRLGIGPSAKDALRVIAPGETIRTPAVHLGVVSGDLDAAVQAMHQHVRRTVLPSRVPERSYLVECIAWGRRGYVVDDGRIRQGELTFGDIDIAAALGMDVFVLDAMWWDEQGDAFPSPTHFPLGMEPVSAYAHEKGMLFGLYDELERAYGKQSQVAREHPEWIGPHGVLDLTRPECAEWVARKLTYLIEQYDLDLYRLDYNPHFTFEGPSTERDGFLESNYWRYYDALYAIFERIRNTHPEVILQQCAGGGARNDLGMVGQFHDTYLTDGLWMPQMHLVYSGLSLGLPPESLVIAVGAIPEKALGRPGNLDTYLRSSFTLSTPLLVVEMASSSLENLDEKRRRQYRHYVDLYHRFMRPLWPTCRMYHHAPVSSSGGVTSSPWFAVEYAAPDGSKAWATIVRTRPSEEDAYLFKPRGLDPGRTYSVTFDNTGRTATVDGWTLTQGGVELRLEAVLSSELLLFEAE